MKIRVEQSDLDNAINKVKGAVNTGNTVIDIVKGFKLTAKDDNLQIRGTDLELEIETNIETFVEEEGEVVIPGSELSKLVKELPSEEITIEKLNNKARISTNNSKFTLSTYNPDEFPEPMSVEENMSFELQPEILEEMITKLNFSCATDDTQPQLNGILLDINEDNIAGVSTNTYRLSYYELDHIFDLENNEVIIPLQATKQIKKLVKDSEEPVKIILSDDKGAVIEFDNQILKTRIIEGRFPDYMQVMPREYNTEVELNTSALKSVLKRVRIIANKESGVINIDVDKQNSVINISAAGNEVGEAHERLNADITGESMSINVDVNYMMDVISKAVDGEFTTLKFTEKLNPMAVIEPSYTHIIMPVRAG